jgi:5'(3')-deoxyribonucleotidase
MRFLVDVDGVLADFMSSAVELINQLTGKNYLKSDIKTWHLFRGLSISKDVEEAVYEAMEMEGWCSELQLIDGSVEAVDFLRQFGEVFFVTSPMNGPHWMYERTEWLIRYFAAERKSIIHCRSKYVCSGDVLIDDRVSNLQDWRKHNTRGVAVKFLGDHNLLDDWEKNSRQVEMSSWSELNRETIELFRILSGAYRK